MRRTLAPVVLLLAMATLVGAQERLDLLPGHGLPTLPAPDRSGFRLAVGGQTVLHVAPEGENRARLIETNGAARIVDLPPALALAIARPAASPAGPPPRLVSADFSTLYDGVTLLLADPPPAVPLRWSATLRLTTDAGHVGNSRVALLRRGERPPNAELDRQLERLVAANPLPPLAGGAARLDVVVAATPGLRPMLSVWVSEPYAEDADWLAPLSRGWLMQEPIGWPTAVVDAKSAAPVRAAYAGDWQAAKAELLAQLAAPGGRMLFGNWRFGAASTLAAARQALASAPPGKADRLVFLGAWALARERRFAEAQQWMAQIGAGSRDAALAAEARWLALAWRRRLGGDARLTPRAPANDATRFVWQIRLNGDDGSAAGDWRAAGAALRKFGAEPARDDADFVQRALVARAASALANAAAELPPLAAAALFAEWTNAETPAADWALFDAGAALLAAGRPTVALEAFRWLLGECPFSPLAPQAAWAAQRAAAAGDRELAKAAAWRIAADCAPDSDWLTARDEAEEMPEWQSAVALRAPAAAEVRLRALRWLRDAEFADYLTAGGGETLSAAERAARLLLDEAPGPEWRRLDWLALGDILHTARRLPEAAQAYANVALDKCDDELRRSALRSLAASLTPDARRVALALAGDARFGPLLAPLRP
jgi:hypothetical protein